MSSSRSVQREPLTPSSSFAASPSLSLFPFSVLVRFSYIIQSFVLANDYLFLFLFAARTRFAPDTTAALAQILKTKVAGFIVALSTRDSAKLTVARAGSTPLARSPLLECSRVLAVSSDLE